MPAYYSKRFPTRRAIIISLVFHMAMLVLISIIPGSGLMFREKPIKVVWVSLPKGSGENIDLNLKESKTLPRSTIQQQKKISKSKGNKAKPMHKPSKKIAKKRKKKKLSPSERRMRRALAQIDKDLKNERGKRANRGPT